MVIVRLNLLLHGATGVPRGLRVSRKSRCFHTRRGNIILMMMMMTLLFPTLCPGYHEGLTEQ
jgi:hypothetical protein